MAYTKIGWVNDRTPAINQNNLNHMDQGIYDAHQKLAEYEDIFTGDVDESVQNWLDEHPEATTTVQDGSVNENKFVPALQEKINNIPALKSNPISLSYNRHVYLDMKTIQGDDWVSLTDFAQQQSFCYNSNNEHLLIGFKGSAQTTSNGLLVEVDKSFNVLQRKQIDLEHCNDIAYNPNTDKYYVVSGSDNPVVYVINPSTLSLDDTIRITLDRGLAQLSYKENENIFIGTEYATNDTYSLDENLNIIEKLFTQTKDADLSYQYPNVVSSDFQGSCIYGNLFVSLYWIYTNGKKSFARLLFFNLENNELATSIDIPTDRYDEPEGIDFYNGKFTIVGYTRQYLTYRNAYINKAPFNDNNEWIDISDAFELADSQSGASLSGMTFLYNWFTNKVRINGGITRASINAGSNHILNIKKNAYKPTDYYVTFPALKGSVPCAGLISGRSSVFIASPASEGGATVFFTVEYDANGIIE